MPELPEVETVRRGLAARVAGRRVAGVQVHHPRAVRRHLPGPDDFAARLRGRVLADAHRRGKYLWLPLDDPPADAMIGHLGMSGQLLLPAPGTPPDPHLRVGLSFVDGAPPLWFVDQRTFGGLSVSTWDGTGVPEQIGHIAPDPLDKAFDDEQFVAALRRRRVAVKVALLDQGLISGVGNIYADEALWRAQLHGQRRSDLLTRPAVRRLVDHVRDVLTEAIDAGGTSFDALYVDVNGDSGWYERELHVYGREGEPCDRCGAPIRREPFANRSSFSCPRCQPRPRLPRASVGGRQPAR
ncbi:MAG: bifunctional DNA-formamidopyrimidine glycosylase/DNA-(apurinic or apyrimidinic site) lyase [Micromonosporaceae bacterium]|nr:bifunctional DNA-formamidopyrimidine glycosylase/DNA-(apurinic or apyrimidinic site) lyase [Micromonosporaceae bacterium]